MKRLFAALLLVAVLHLSAHAQQPVLPWTWETTAAKIDRSLVYIAIEVEGGTGVCAGWSIDKRASRYMTAAHCVGTTMMLDGKISASVVFLDEPGDMLVLQADSPYQKPALHPSRTRLQRGTPVAAMGFGQGWPIAMFRAGTVSIPSISPRDFAYVEYMITDFAFVGGMSGGPIFDTNGDVVGLVNRSFRDGTMGAGRTLAALKAAVPTWR
jgi:S1-C subfamily serine protease